MLLRRDNIGHLHCLAQHLGRFVIYIQDYVAYHDKCCRIWLLLGCLVRDASCEQSRHQ